MGGRVARAGATRNGGRARTEDLQDRLSLPEGTGVPAGRYTFYAVDLGHGPPEGQLLRTDAGATLGTFYDGWRGQLEVSPTWNVSRHLELGGTYQVNRVRFSDRDEAFTAHVVRARVRVALNKKVSTNAFAQYNSAASLATADVRFRYNVEEGHDLWVVYNERLNLNRDRKTPTLPWTDARSVLVKYNYTIQW